MINIIAYCYLQLHQWEQWHVFVSLLQPHSVNIQADQHPYHKTLEVCCYDQDNQLLSHCYNSEKNNKTNKDNTKRSPSIHNLVTI